MKPKRIILIRHGESVGNVDPSVYKKTPDYALDLTEEGRKQVQNAGREISNIIGATKVFAYVSPWKRTRLTYQGIVETLKDRVVKTVEEPLLREQDWGYLADIETLARINKERAEYGQFYYRVPNGESGADVYQRMCSLLTTMHRHFENPSYPDNALLVTHGMTLRVFLCRFFRFPIEYFETIENPFNAEIFVIERDALGIYRLLTPLRHQPYNDAFEMAM